MYLAASYGGYGLALPFRETSVLTKHFKPSPRLASMFSSVTATGCTQTALQSLSIFWYFFSSHSTCIESIFTPLVFICLKFTKRIFLKPFRLKYLTADQTKSRENCSGICCLCISCRARIHWKKKKAVIHFATIPCEPKDPFTRENCY